MCALFRKQLNFLTKHPRCNIIIIIIIIIAKASCSVPCVGLALRCVDEQVMPSSKWLCQLEEIGLLKAIARSAAVDLTVLLILYYVLHWHNCSWPARHGSENYAGPCLHC